MIAVLLPMWFLAVQMNSVRPTGRTFFSVRRLVTSSTWSVLDVSLAKLTFSER